MNTPHLIARRLRALFGKQKLDAEMAEEMRAHLELQAAENEKRGMSAEEARYAAQRMFGGVEQIKERARDGRGLRWFDELLNDIRFAARSLRKSPGFTTVAILTLALCLGANSAVFSAVYAILLKPYPWPDSDRLVYIHNTYSLVGRERAGCTIPDYLDRRNGVTALEESALIKGEDLNLAATDSAPDRVAGFWITPSLFPLLRARPAFGRTFSEDDAQIGATKTVVLSDVLWRNRFGADPRILGTDIRLNGEPYTVIGVMPPGFYFPGPFARLWVPFAFSDFEKSDRARSLMAFSPMIGRLKPGATLVQAQREINAISKANKERLPQLKRYWESSGFGGIVTNFLETEIKDVRTMLWLVQGAVAAALLIGCANVTSLLLSRASARERELAIRAALGAGRSRLIRHLLTESVLLFVTGGLVGLLVASWGITAMNNLGVGNLPRGFGVSLDFAALGFTLACAAATGLAFGALPAWSATRGDNANTLKDAGARATTGRRHLSLRSTLVVTEIALALMLLATAALLIKSFQRVQRVSPGFVRENVLTAVFRLPAAKYGTPEKQILFHRQVLERVRALPSVTSVACTSRLPLTPWASDSSPYQIDGHEPSADQPETLAMIRHVSPDYFRAMGIRLQRGREFTEHDTVASEDVVVIDKLFADRNWPGEDPIGKRLISGFKPVPSGKARQPRKWEVIGVIAPVKGLSLDVADTKEVIYFPTFQGSGRMSSTLVVKTAGPPAQLIALLRAAVQAVDPDQPVFDIKTMEARVEESLERRTTPMILIAVFGGLSLLLAAIGVYGVLAFAVGQRTQEIGIRMALGATRANILRLILSQGVWLLTFGLVLGLGGYFALSTLIRKLLFSVEPTDFAALLLAPLALALVALAACLIPARRATKVDPMVALRCE